MTAEEAEITSPGFYFNHRTSELVEFHPGDKFPYDPGKWEFIGTSEEFTPSDAVAALLDRYPEVNVELKACAEPPIPGHEVYIHGIHGRPRGTKDAGKQNQ
ncbi:MAG: hypothetical protein M1358_17165 [Chloroflexi bacterium]|nr:hypothetical protein [Chloroflexota bacterium]